MGNQQKEDRLHFHLQLLLDVREMNKYPFTKLVINKELSRGEYEETIKLLETLSMRFEQDQEEGFVSCTPLLIHFAGMLNPKLPVQETLQALKDERLYTALVIRLIEEAEKLYE